MKKKSMVGIFAVAMITLFGVNFVAAYDVLPRDIGYKGNMTSEEVQRMQEFGNSLQTAIKNNDYTAWKSSMESQLTQDKFNKLVERYKDHPERRNFKNKMKGRVAWHNAQTNPAVN